MCSAFLNPPYCYLIQFGSWWHRGKETFYALQAIWEGNPVDSPHKKPVTRCFDVYFDVRRVKRLNKQGSRRCAVCLYLYTCFSFTAILSLTVLSDKLCLLPFTALKVWKSWSVLLINMYKFVQLNSSYHICYDVCISDIFEWLYIIQCKIPW